MRPEASIVNVASLAGWAWRDRMTSIKAVLELDDEQSALEFCKAHGITDEDSYGFSKELLIAWTLMNCSALLHRDIRMNCISPGPVDTPILKDFRGTIGKRFEREAALLQ